MREVDALPHHAELPQVLVMRTALLLLRFVIGSPTSPWKIVGLVEVNHGSAGLCHAYELGDLPMEMLVDDRKLLYQDVQSLQEVLEKFL